MYQGNKGERLLNWQQKHKAQQILMQRPISILASMSKLWENMFYFKIKYVHQSSAAYNLNLWGCTWNIFSKCRYSNKFVMRWLCRVQQRHLVFILNQSVNCHQAIGGRYSFAQSHFILVHRYWYVCFLLYIFTSTCITFHVVSCSVILMNFVPMSHFGNLNTAVDCWFILIHFALCHIIS